MKNLNKRTSIRKYAPREVSDELLYRLLREAERTQTMGNLQLYSVVITRSEKQKEALAPAHFNQPMVKGAPVVLTFCADFRRKKKEMRNQVTITFFHLSMLPPMRSSTVRHSATLQMKKDWAIAI